MDANQRSKGEIINPLENAFLQRTTTTKQTLSKVVFCIFAYCLLPEYDDILIEDALCFDYNL